MKTHRRANTARSTADDGSQSISVWQSIAIATSNIITPGNVISILGLALVLIGSLQLYQGDWLAGLGLLIAGRFMDLADGYIARSTGTKSPIGEIIDTTCDKIGVLAVLVVAAANSLLPIPLLAILTIHHLYMALFGILWGRRYRLHTNRWGKLAMFTSWVAIFLSIADAKQPEADWQIAAITAIAVYGALAVTAIYTYYHDLQRAIVARLRAAKWTLEIGEIVFAYNPKASNYKRAQKWLHALEKKLGQKATRINMLDGEGALQRHLRKRTPSKAKPMALVLVAGGDGTVSTAVNQLCELPAATQANLYVLPLWGGNANDFSYMLNGMSNNQTAPRLLAQSAAMGIPLIKIEMVTKPGAGKRGRTGATQTTQTMYACCYASFGASAYAARQLDQRRLSTRKLIRWFPPLVIIRELFAVLKALVTSPIHRARIGSKESVIYEHSIINGSRIAKVNRVPIELNEPIFFHAVVEPKGASIILDILRIILRRPGANYAKRSTVTFTTQSALDAQIDGEILRLAAGTHVKATILHNKLRFISTRLNS